MGFGAVISLGANCQAAYQIRRVLGVEVAYVFDWLVISPSAAAEAIRADFRVPLGADRLELRHDHILDRPTGTRFVHDFPIDPGFLDHLPRVRDKYEFLGARTAEAAQRDPLFVMTAVKPHKVRRVTDALTDVLGARWRLLIANGGDASSEPIDNVTFCRLGETQHQHGRWRGDDAGWEAAFRAVIPGLPTTVQPT